MQTRALPTPERLESHEARAWSDLYRLAPSDLARELGVRCREFGTGVAVVAAAIDILAQNRVVGLGLDGPVPAATLDGIEALYRDAGARRYFVQVAPGTDPRLPGQLEARGYELHNRWLKLSRGVEPGPVVRTDLRVERIGPERGRDFGEVFIAAFEWPERLVPWIAALVGAPGWRHYLAYDGDRPVATGAMHLAGPSAWIDFASTLPEARGRGAQAALIERRIDDAAREGVETLVVEAGDGSGSYRNLERAGFRLEYARPNWRLDLG